jgi:hypothetical protein
VFVFFDLATVQLPRLFNGVLLGDKVWSMHMIAQELVIYLSDKVLLPEWAAHEMFKSPTMRNMNVKSVPI